MIKTPHHHAYLMKELIRDYGEWIEHGVSVDSILLSLLHEERKKNYELSMKIDYLNKKGNS